MLDGPVPSLGGRDDGLATPSVACLGELPVGIGLVLVVCGPEAAWAIARSDRAWVALRFLRFLFSTAAPGRGGE
jgi:hypothetical protein